MIDSRRVERAKYKRKKIDGYTCCNCGYHKGIPFINRELHAHHCYDESSYPKYAASVRYMRTLCEPCHLKSFHGKWMKGTQVSCTIWDYRKWRTYEEIVNFAWLRRLLKFGWLVKMLK